jgi:hypothetical protein
LGALACSDAGGPAAPPEGTASDVMGDGGTADLVGIHVVVEGDSIVFRADFAPGDVGLGNIRAVIELDVNGPGIGDPGTDPLSGRDYTVVVFENAGQPTLYAYSGGQWLGQGQAGRTVVLTNQLMAKIPLSSLGGDDGRLRLKIGSAFYESGCSCYASQDWLTDPGVSPVNVQ